MLHIFKVSSLSDVSLSLCLLVLQSKANQSCGDLSRQATPKKQTPTLFDANVRGCSREVQQSCSCPRSPVPRSPYSRRRSLLFPNGLVWSVHPSDLSTSEVPLHRLIFPNATCRVSSFWHLPFGQPCRGGMPGLAVAPKHQPVQCRHVSNYCLLASNSKHPRGGLESFLVGLLDADSLSSKPLPSSHFRAQYMNQGSRYIGMVLGTPGST